jgi:hypothetical protein
MRDVVRMEGGIRTISGTRTRRLRTVAAVRIVATMVDVVVLMIGVAMMAATATIGQEKISMDPFRS